MLRTDLISHPNQLDLLDQLDLLVDWIYYGSIKLRHMDLFTVQTQAIENGARSKPAK